MGYCFMTIGKIKTQGALKAKYNHNYRLADVENADPALFYKNKTLSGRLTEPGGSTMDYNEAWNERIDSLDYYKNHRIRSNAVLAQEVIMTFTKQESINLEAWQKKNVEWLENVFNVAGDGKSNILDVTYHADEPGNVHIHAIVVPIDERGHLNASRFTGGSRAMSELQNDYARAMSEFGLERGLENSPANHNAIRKYYAELNRSINGIPVPYQDEKGCDYQKRVLENLQTIYAAALRDVKEKERKGLEKANKTFLEQKMERIAMHREKEDLTKEIEMLRQQKAELEKLGTVSMEEYQQMVYQARCFQEFKKEFPLEARVVEERVRQMEERDEMEINSDL